MQKLFRKGIRNNKGQGTIEILVALALITLSVVAVVLVVSTSQSLSLDSVESTRALALARENLEIAKASAEANFSGLTNSTSTQDEFTKAILVASTAPYIKQVTSRVSWRTDPLRTQKVELTMLLTDLAGAQAAGGDTGGVGLSGDWTHPVTLGSINLGPGEQATGLDVLNKIVYLSAIASDPKNPTSL